LRGAIESKVTKGQRLAGMTYRVQKREKMLRPGTSEKPSRGAKKKFTGRKYERGIEKQT